MPKSDHFDKALKDFDKSVSFTLIDWTKLQNSELKKTWDAVDCNKPKAMAPRVASEGGEESEPEDKNEESLRFHKFQVAKSGFPGPDRIAELVLASKDPRHKIPTTRLMNLPASKNKYQVSYTDEGTPRFGEVQDRCNRPWAIHNTDAGDLHHRGSVISLSSGSTGRTFRFPDGQQDHLESSHAPPITPTSVNQRGALRAVRQSSMEFFTGKEHLPSPKYVQEVCEKTKALASQKETSRGRVRVPFASYSELRTAAIQKFDARPCIDPDLEDWPEVRENLMTLLPVGEAALGTQQCFRCTKTDSGTDLGTWRCPVLDRREGLFIGVTAQHLDSRRNCVLQDTVEGEARFSESVCVSVARARVRVCVWRGAGIPAVVPVT